MIFYDSVSSGASLSANETKQEGVEQSTPFVFYACGISLLIDVGMENKVVDLSTSCEVKFVRASAASGRERR